MMLNLSTRADGPVLSRISRSRQVRSSRSRKRVSRTAPDNERLAHAQKFTPNRRRACRRSKLTRSSEPTDLVAWPATCALHAAAIQARSESLMYGRPNEKALSDERIQPKTIILA